MRSSPKFKRILVRATLLGSLFASPAQSCIIYGNFPTNLEIPAGAIIHLETSSEINSKTARTGERIYASVQEDVKIGEITAIKAGTSAIGRVAFASKNGAFGKSGKIDLIFEFLELDECRIAVFGMHSIVGQGKTGMPVAAAIVGGLAGAAIITGRSATLPTGSVIKVRLVRPVNFAPNL